MIKLARRFVEQMRDETREPGRHPIGGPDIWEVAMWIDDLGPVRDPAAKLGADGIVTRAQIDAALAYCAAYPEEIQARIELHRSETAAADAR